MVQLARAHRRADLIAAGAIGGVLGALPLRIRALTKDRLGSTGMLDYERSQIRLVVDSEAELPRLNSCRKEPETVAWIERFVRPGDVVFDIGANVGAYSLVVDRAAGGQCTVYAFEPSFSTFAQLSRNVALNGGAGPSDSGAGRAVRRERPDHVQLQQSGTRRRLPRARRIGRQLGRPFTPALSQPVLSYRMDDFVGAVRRPGRPITSSSTSTASSSRC